MPVDALHVTAVHVGLPGTIGERRGRPVESAIAKARVEESDLHLGVINLAGDRPSAEGPGSSQ